MILASILLYYYQLIQTGSTTPAILRDYAVVESLEANIDPQVIETIIERESGFDPTKTHYNDGAVGCDSRGLVQIRSCDHDTTTTEAYDPIYAINFLIANIDKCTTWWRATCPIKSG